ncbi:hypothetical protein DSO57_1012634 [Entomophthora muscae]|uniref:Uncharacterized protein n=1 Tax=Entomophthora muscae TaxID=34485 RepID=A0ACC2S7X3_9FUNG|nr:hypothetical protein DSO57_1012634 [Entomophthora muscae]
MAGQLPETGSLTQSPVPNSSPEKSKASSPEFFDFTSKHGTDNSRGTRHILIRVAALPPLTLLTGLCPVKPVVESRKDKTIPDHKFKTLNLPTFDQKGNIKIFICLFKISMCGASDHMKTTALINALDPASVDVIMPQLLAEEWSYENAKLQ